MFMFEILKSFLKGFDSVLKYIEKHSLLWIFCFLLMFFFLKPCILPNFKLGVFVHGTDNFYGIDTLENAQTKGIFVPKEEK